MRYIKKYTTEQEIQDALNNSELGKPYVTFLEGENKLDWNTKTKKLNLISLAEYFDGVPDNTIPFPGKIYLKKDWVLGDGGNRICSVPGKSGKSVSGCDRITMQNPNLSVKLTDNTIEVIIQNYEPVREDIESVTVNGVDYWILDFDSWYGIKEWYLCIYNTIWDRQFENYPDNILIESDKKVQEEEKKNINELSADKVYEVIEIGRYIYIPTDWKNYTGSTTNTFICCSDNTLLVASPSTLEQNPVLKLQNNEIRFRSVTANVIDFVDLTPETINIDGVEYYKIDMFEGDDTLVVPLYLCGVTSSRNRLLTYLNNGGTILYSN